MLPGCCHRDIKSGKSVKEDYNECFKFFDELIRTMDVFKSRATYAENYHGSINSLRSYDSLGASRETLTNHAPPRRSKSYGSIPNEVFRSLKKNVKKNGSMKNLLRSLHSPLSHTKSYES